MTNKFVVNIRFMLSAPKYADIFVNFTQISINMMLYSLNKAKVASLIKKALPNGLVGDKIMAGPH